MQIPLPVLSLGGADNPTTPTPKPDPAVKKTFDQYEKEARRILDQIKKYAPDGSSPNGAKWAEASARLKAFTKDNDLAEAAVEYVRAGMKKTGEVASKYGQQFDALKGKLSVTESLDKLGQPAAQIEKRFAGIQAQALQAAEAEKKRNGETEKYRALLDLAGDAAKKLESARDRKPEETPLEREQAIQKERLAMEALEKSIRKASRARLDNIVAGGVTADTSLAKWEAARKEIERRDTAKDNPQLSQLEKDQRAQREMQAQAKLEADLRNAGNGRLGKIVAGGVTPEVSLEKWKAADAEIKRRQQIDDQMEKDRKAEEKQRGKESAKLAQELSSLQIDKAQATAARLKSIDDQALKDVGDNLTKRLDLVKKNSQAEYDRQVAIAAAIRAKALQDAKGKPNEGALRDLAFENYRGAETTARNTRADAVTTANKAVQDSVRSLRNEYAQLADGMREKVKAGKVEADDVTAYLATLDALRVKTDAAGLSNNKFLTGAQQSANGVLDDALLTSDALKNLPDGFNRAARAGQGFTVSLEDALAQLPVGAQATEVYVRALEELAAEGKVAKETVEAVKQAITDRAVIWQMEADEIRRVTDEAVRNADTLAELGDTEGAIDALSTTLSGLYDRLGQGEDVADAIGLVIDKINELGAALSLDTEFNSFVAGLGGSLSDQIEQVVEKLAGTTDTKLKGRLQTLLTDLRGQIAQAYSTTYEIPDGRQPAKPDEGPGYDAIARARDLQTALAGPTDPDAVGATPAELQALMGDAATLLSSEVGKKLPEATRTALEEAVRGAEGYISTLSDITADAVTDGWERGRKDAPAPPQNRYAETMATLTLMGGELADETKREAVTEGLNQMRQAGELTGEQLTRLLKIIEQLGGDTLRFKGVKEEMEALTSSLKVGTISLEDFAGQAGPLTVRMERLADAAERNKDPKLAAQYRDLAVQLRNLIPVIEDTESAFVKLEDAAQSVGDGLASIFNAFGMGDFAKISSSAAGLFKVFQDGRKAIFEIGPAFQKSFTSGLSAVGGFLSVVGAGINLVGQIGDAILNLSPKFQAWKKNLIEVANLQTKAANMNGGLLGNPYADALNEDAGKRQELAGAGFWKRAWWALTGSAPKVMSDEAARLKSQAAEIFADLGQTISNTLESSLMDAFLKADFGGVEEAMKKSLDTFVVKTAIQAIIQKSRLKELVEDYADEAVAGGDLTDERAAIDAEVGNINRGFQAIAPGLPGYGSGAGTGASNSGSMFGAAPEMQLGVPRIEVTLPDTLMRPLGEFASAVPVFARAADKWERIADRIAASLRNSGGLQGSSGLSGLT